MSHSFEHFNVICTYEYCHNYLFCVILVIALVIAPFLLIKTQWGYHRFPFMELHLFLYDF